MSDLNWCTFCDHAISQYSQSLYCSEKCLRDDALRNHPLLGYTYREFVDFPRPYSTRRSPSTSTYTSPALSATTAISLPSVTGSPLDLKTFQPKIPLFSLQS
ncbi:hypothetical protein CLU79DRAFT_763851 [Phycomyces nitens]|nr:hypothetical protein CLU79DRAFT_763851 [Phycomyces nitens]